MLRKIRERYLIEDFEKVLKHAWSARLIYLAALLTGLEAIVPLCGAHLPGPEWARALAILLVVAAALVARVMVQRKYGAS